jgi:hypothetical protein
MTMEIKLLEARLYFRSWTGVVQLALLEAGPKSAIAIDISTYSGGPRRRPGFELSTDKIECVRLPDASKKKTGNKTGESVLVPLGHVSPQRWSVARARPNLTPCPV